MDLKPERNFGLVTIQFAKGFFKSSGALTFAQMYTPVGFIDKLNSS